MTEQIAQYTGNRPSPQMPLPGGRGFECIIILVHDDNFNFLMEKIEAWFEDRDEIILVSSGEMSKEEMSYISLEWEGVKVDPLFIAILYDEDRVYDYVYYKREI